MIQTIAFLLLSILAIIAIVKLLANLVCCIIGNVRNKMNPKHHTRIRNTAVFFIVVMAINLALVTFTQFAASTPDIRDEHGNIPADSIAELIPIELNGRKQWISIRAENKNKPVLLFLAGGPGGTQLAAVRHELSELEKHFVVVGWDQPGSGKSYYAKAIKDITAETYIQDGRELTKYLAKRFDQEKIYLVGESWGSALGIFLVDRYPESYHALIGTGQMIDFAETERIDYALAMEMAVDKNDTATVKKLEANGQPPYYGKNLTWKSAVYLNYLSSAMASNPAINNPGYNTLRDIFSPEYGILDKINFARGVINTYNNVYQQLYDIDLRTDYTSLDVPVYFFEGRYDINAPTSLVEEYYNVLDCPEKEIVWFEHSGHSPWINENSKFADELLLRFSAVKSNNYEE